MLFSGIWDDFTMISTVQWGGQRYFYSHPRTDDT